MGRVDGRLVWGGLCGMWLGWLELRPRIVCGLWWGCLVGVVGRESG